MKISAERAAVITSQIMKLLPNHNIDIFCCTDFAELIIAATGDEQQMSDFLEKYINSLVSVYPQYGKDEMWRVFDGTLRRETQRLFELIKRREEAGS